MLGDLILEHIGKVSSKRVLDSKKEKMENTVTSTGVAKGGIDTSFNITYWNIHCGNGLYYGEGSGKIISKDGGDEVKVTEYGVGRSHVHKTIWRGSSFYQIPASLNDNRLSFPHGLVGVFETDVYEAENVIEKVWEWK